jgi:uncharacterized protein (TIGR02246 family)
MMIGLGSWIRRSAALLLAGTLALHAVVPLQAEESTALAQEIDAMHGRYLAAFNGRDAASLAALFTEDGLFVDPAGHVTAGRAAIEAMFARDLHDAELTLEVHADRIGSLGDGAWDIGHGVQIIGRDGAQQLRLHYAAVYQRRAGVLELRVVSVGVE